MKITINNLLIQLNCSIKHLFKNFIIKIKNFIIKNYNFNEKQRERAKYFGPTILKLLFSFRHFNNEGLFNHSKCKALRPKHQGANLAFDHVHFCSRVMGNLYSLWIPMSLMLWRTNPKSSQIQQPPLQQNSFPSPGPSQVTFKSIVVSIMQNIPN